MKDGAALKEDGRVSVNRDAGPNGSYEITIKKVEAGDAGTYSVKATNNFGNAECSAKVGCKGNENSHILSIPGFFSTDFRQTLEVNSYCYLFD